MDDQGTGSGASPRARGLAELALGPVSGWDTAAALVALAWFLVLITLEVLQYEALRNRSVDLALYARSLWGLAHGSPFNPLSDQHVLAMHGSWILYPLAPLTWLVSAPVLLLVLQTAALAVGGVVAYSIAIRRLGSRPRAFVVLALTLLGPLAVNTLLEEAHPQVLATPFLLAGLDRLERLGWRSLGAWGLLLPALGCHEEVALLAGVVGLAWLVDGRTRGSGAVLAAAGLGLFALSVLGLRAWLGADPASEALLLGQLTPAAIAERLLAWQNALYLLFLLLSFAFLPVLGLRYSGPAALVAAIVMLGASDDTDSPLGHSSFLAFPFLLLATIAALARLGERSPRWGRAALAAALGCMGVSYVVSGEGPGSLWFSTYRFAFTEETRIVLMCIDEVPSGAPAMAPPNIVAHFAERRLVDYRLAVPSRLRQLEYVLIEDVPPDQEVWPESYARYLASRRRQVELLTEVYGFAPLARCGSYVLLHRGRERSRGQGEVVPAPTGP